MVGKKIIEAIKFLGQKLEDDGVRDPKIILFGSQSKATVIEGSDIDIVIISKKFERRNIFERASLTKSAEIETIKRFMIPFDIVTLSPNDWKNGTSLVVEFAKKGKVIYGNKKRR